MSFRIFGLMILCAMLGACSTSPILRSTIASAPSPSEIPRTALGYYTLPKALVPVTITFPTCSAEQAKSQNGGCPAATLALGTPLYVADSRHFYAVDAALSAYSSDNLMVEVDGDGFLKSIEANAKDETGGVILKVADVIKGAATTVASFGNELTFLKLNKPGAEKLASKDVSYPEVTLTALLDLSAASADEIVRLEKRLINPALRYGADRKLSINVLRPRVSGAEPSAGCTQGVCYRPHLSYRIALDVTDHLGSVNSWAQLAVSLPNDSPVLMIGLDRTTFVERKGKLTFANGTLTKVEVLKPSEALAAANVPVEALKTLASIPADLLTLRIKQSTDAKTLADAQAALLESQAKLAKAIADAAKQ